MLIQHHTEISIAGMLALYVEKLEREETSHTARTYRNGIKHFVIYLQEEYGFDGSEPASKLEMECFIRFPSWLIRSDFRRGTSLVYMYAVDYLLTRFLVIENYLAPSAVEMLKYEAEKKRLNRKQSDQKPRDVTERDMQRMITAAESMEYDCYGADLVKPRNLAIVLLLASSAIRNEEACNLRCRDISWNSTYDKPFVHVEHGKGDKSRDIPFSREAWAAIKEYWKIRKFSAPDDPVFARHDKGSGKRKGKRKPITTATVRNVVKAVRYAAGLEAAFSPHWFRHGVVTKIVRKTHDLELARQQAGHTSINMTARYTHLLKEDLVKAHNEVFEE